MMKWYKAFLPAAVVVALFFGTAFAANELLTFDNEDLRNRYTDLTFQLRCPKCQNQNVADSNAPISEDIRHKTYEMLHQGYSDQEIVDFMVERYTEFVVYKPQFSFVTIWLWIVPALLLILGLSILLKLTLSNRKMAGTELTDTESERLKTIMEDKS